MVRILVTPHARAKSTPRTFHRQGDAGASVADPDAGHLVKDVPLLAPVRRRGHPHPVSTIDGEHYSCGVEGGDLDPLLQVLLEGVKPPRPGMAAEHCLLRSYRARRCSALSPSAAKVLNCRPAPRHRSTNGAKIIALKVCTSSSSLIQLTVTMTPARLLLAGRPQPVTWSSICRRRRQPPRIVGRGSWTSQWTIFCRQDLLVWSAQVEIRARRSW